MNLRELLIPFSLALLTTWAIQHFFNFRTPKSETTTEQEQGAFVQAPKTDHIEVHKPLNIEIDFLDKISSKKPVITKIESDKARYVFSTEGASLESLEFKRKWGNSEGYLSTVFAPSATEREKRCFLIAFENKTPYSYELVTHKPTQDIVTLLYSADFEDGTISKEYKVFKDKYLIELLITIQPKDSILQPRIFFPSPLVPQLGKDDWAKGIVANVANKIQIYEKNDQTLSGYWSKPTLFGTEDRYFINALIADPDHYTQRAYYRIHDFENLYSILEGPSISQPTSWRMSFYFGPKEDTAIKNVDERLTQVLNYGWFAPISRPVSKILLNILNFLFDYLKNYGLAIIVLTFFMKLILLPFTFNSEKSRKKGVEFQKKLQYIKEKYKHDKDALALANTELVKKYGMPGMGGVLVLFLQIPLFLALSWVLANSIELYKAPFLWIKDLSASDPYYILPLLVAVSMFFHNPTQTTDPKQKISMISMAVIMGGVSTTLSAGLVLYILISTLLGIAQAHLAKRFAA